MSKEARVAAGPIARSSQTLQPACGSVRVCVPYAGELARHRLISADGCDYVVATVLERGRSVHYVTGAYPVTRGYLVMLRQPLCEIRSEHADRARREHEALVQVLAEAGVSVVRARRILARCGVRSQCASQLCSRRRSAQADHHQERGQCIERQHPAIAGRL